MPVTSVSQPTYAAKGPIRDPALLNYPFRNSLSVFTYNTRHREVGVQLEGAADRLKSDFGRPPDFMLCQEIVFELSKNGERNTAEFLADRLGYHAKATRRSGGMEGVAILSRYPFDHYEALHLDARAAFLAGGFPRVSVMGEFLVPEIGRVRVVNVHLAWSKKKDEVRQAQLRETLDWIAERDRAVPADVIILGGDFNANPGWPELSVLREPLPDSGLLFENHNSRRPTQGKNGTQTRRLDYVFVTARHREVEFLGEGLLWQEGIVGRDGVSRYRPSDHVPLLHVYAFHRR